jgi:hypothetical protein
MAPGMEGSGLASQRQVLGWDKSAIGDRQLTDLLAQRVLQWKSTPDRYVKPGRSWTPRWKFTPLTRLDDAFLLADRAATNYRLLRNEHRFFEAHVQVAGRSGTAGGKQKARVLVLALARALELIPPE